MSNGGVAFKPYQTRQGEVGVKVDTGSYGGTVSLFQSRKPSYAAVDGVFAQAIAQRNSGAELSVYGEALPGLRVLGGASFLHEVSGAGATGKHAIGAPASQFNLGFDWDVPGAIGLVLDARAVHTSTQYADAANMQVVPSWTRLDIGGRYAIDIAVALGDAARRRRQRRQPQLLGLGRRLSGRRLSGAGRAAHVLVLGHVRVLMAGRRNRA